MRGAIVWLGQGDPVKTMARLRRNDPALVALRSVLSAWRDQFGDEPQTSDTVIEVANATIATLEPGTLGTIRTHTHPALRSALLTVAGRGGAIDPRALGQWLGRSKNRVVNLSGEDDAKDEVALEPGGILHGSNRWRVVTRSGANVAKDERDEEADHLLF